ncbi:MAG TPA: DNA repair protein RadC [Thermoanaerobaculia bacterium]|nr:DNA repair protein RadC [Thermoanaerobaculia bacterium]
MQELIADLPLDDRPREKMRRHGAGTLSDAELLAILIGSGTRGISAIQLARELLRDGGLPSIGRSSADALARTRGIGDAKATRIAAAFEIARRVAAPSEDGERYDDALIGRALISRYSHEAQEHLGAVLLDSRRRVLKQCEIFVGTVARALVSARDVVRIALEANAVGVVLFHNHPSGDPSPSAEDLSFTKKVQQSLALVDIELVDHLIAGAQRYCSMRGRGLL